MAYICAACETVHETVEDLGLKRYRESQPLMYDRGYAEVDVVERVCIECGSDDVYEDTAYKCNECGEVGLDFPQTGAGDWACPDCGRDSVEEI